MKLMVRRVLMLMEREWYRVSADLVRFILYQVIIWPVLFAVSTVYFSGLSLFGEQSAMQATTMFLGVALMHYMVISFYQTFPFLKERTIQHIVQYHVSVTSYASMFWARYLFGVLFAYLLSVPYMFIAKLVLGDRLYTVHLNWFLLVGMQFILTAFLVAYIFLCIGTLTSMNNVGSTWKRVLEPLMWIGGMWAPGYAMCQAFPRTAFLIKLNPFYYATEAIRQVVLRSDKFLPLSISCTVLVGMTVVCVAASYFVMRHRLQML